MSGKESLLKISLTEQILLAQKDLIKFLFNNIQWHF